MYTYICYIYTLTFCKIHKTIISVHTGFIPHTCGPSGPITHAKGFRSRAMVGGLSYHVRRWQVVGLRSTCLAACRGGPEVSAIAPEHRSNMTSQRLPPVVELTTPEVERQSRRPTSHGGKVMH